jgi:hypothetical protein
MSPPPPEIDGQGTESTAAERQYDHTVPMADPQALGAEDTGRTQPAVSVISVI